MRRDPAPHVPSPAIRPPSFAGIDRGAIKLGPPLACQIKALPSSVPEKPFYSFAHSYPRRPIIPPSGSFELNVPGPPSYIGNQGQHKVIYGDRMLAGDSFFYTAERMAKDTQLHEMRETSLRMAAETQLKVDAENERKREEMRLAKGAALAQVCYACICIHGSMRSPSRGRQTSISPIEAPLVHRDLPYCVPAQRACRLATLWPHACSMANTPFCAHTGWPWTTRRAPLAKGAAWFYAPAGLVSMALYTQH